MTFRKAGLAVACCIAAFVPAGPGRSAENPSFPELHWYLPEQISDSLQAADPGYGAGMTQTSHLVRHGGRLLLFMITAGGGGARNMSVDCWERSEAGRWESPCSTAGSMLSTPVVMEDRVVFLAGGGGAGLCAGILRPPGGGEQRFATVELDARDEPVSKFVPHRQSPANVSACSMVLHRGRLVAVYGQWEYGGAKPAVEFLAVSSGDGGSTWSEKVPVGREEIQNVYTATAEIWTAGGRLHAVCGATGRLQHRISEDDGQTWTDGPDLPQLSDKKGIGSLRVFPGKDRLLALAAEGTGGRSGQPTPVWLCVSRDNGDTWEEPKKLPDVKSDPGGTLNGTSLIDWDGRLILSHGTVSINTKPRADPTRGYDMQATVTGGALVSCDMGETWKRLDSHCAGLTGKVGGARFLPAPDGTIDTVLRWLAQDCRSSGILYRRGSLAPEAPPDADTQKRISGFVADLAADDYRTREQALANLAALGIKALPALRAAAADKDAERSLAAEEILRRISPPWLKP